MDRILIILKKENGPRASSAPALGLNTILFKHVYWYMQQISGERLQDHWSSVFYMSSTMEKERFTLPTFKCQEQKANNADSNKNRAILYVSLMFIISVIVVFCHFQSYNYS